MVEIRPRFVERGDRIALRRGAPAEARDLGKDEPHPVRALGAASDLRERRLVYAILRVHESVEIMGGRSLVCRSGMIRSWVGRQLFLRAAARDFQHGGRDRRLSR